jgi:hypothetical protein
VIIKVLRKTIATMANDLFSLYDLSRSLPLSPERSQREASKRGEYSNPDEIAASDMKE